MNGECISFSQLYTKDFELCDLYAERQTWIDGLTYTRDKPRKSSAVIFLGGCTGKYTAFDGSSFSAPRGSLVCLPYASKYSVLNISSKLASPDALLVEFNAVSDGNILTFSDRPFLIKDANAFYAGELCTAAVREYEALIKSPSAVKSAVYRLLAYIGREAMNSKNAEYSLITPAVEFLENNAAATASVDTLAEMCHVSPGYFRRLFREYAGKSPVQYIIDRKIESAKKLLEDSGTPVSHIAEILGFQSCSYFCKLFKKKTGTAPAEYRKKC